MSKVDDILILLANNGREQEGMKLLKILHDTSISDTLIARMISTAKYPIDRKAVKRWRIKNNIKEG